VTVREPEWTEHDRALVLAHLAEEADRCPECGYPRSVCRDKNTARTWQAVREICQPSVMAQVEFEAIHRDKVRGAVVTTRRTPGVVI
jgi:hypothetical protein